MADLTDIQAAEATKLVGANSSGVEQTPVNSTTGGGLHTNLRDNSGIEISSSINDAINNELILATKTPDTATSTVALNALSVIISIPVEGLSGVGFQILAGTFIGSITPEISIDGGITWFASQFYDFSLATTILTQVFTSNNTTKLLTIYTLGGTTNARVMVSAFTSGTANARLSATHGTSTTITPAGASGGAAAAFNTVATTTPNITNNVATLIVPANPSRKYLNISNPSGSLCYISLGSTIGLTNSTGIPLPARTFLELRGDNLYTGAIYAQSSSSIIFFITQGTP